MPEWFVSLLLFQLATAEVQTENTSVENIASFPAIASICSLFDLLPESTERQIAYLFLDWRAAIFPFSARVAISQADKADNFEKSFGRKSLAWVAGIKPSPLNPRG